jgi:hypothetical protein
MVIPQQEEHTTACGTCNIDYQSLPKVKKVNRGLLPDGIVSSPGAGGKHAKILNS